MSRSRPSSRRALPHRMPPQTHWRDVEPVDDRHRAEEPGRADRGRSHRGRAGRHGARVGRLGAAVGAAFARAGTAAEPDLAGHRTRSPTPAVDPGAGRRGAHRPAGRSPAGSRPRRGARWTLARRGPRPTRARRAGSWSSASLPPPCWPGACRHVVVGRPRRRAPAADGPRRGAPSPPSRTGASGGRARPDPGPRAARRQALGAPVDPCHSADGQPGAPAPVDPYLERGTVTATRLRVEAGRVPVPGPRQVTLESAAFAFAKTSSVHLSYLLSGALERSPGSTRALARVTSLDLYARPEPKPTSYAFSGARILTLACTPAASAAVAHTVRVPAGTRLDGPVPPGDRQAVPGDGPARPVAPPGRPALSVGSTCPRSGHDVAHQVVDQVVAVLGEDRLGVELDAAEVRAADQVDVAGLRVGLDLDARRQRAVRTGPRRCCRSRPARSGRRCDTGDWVPWKTMSL